MINITELLRRQVSEWQTEVSRLQGLIAIATENSAPPSSPQQLLIDVGTGKIAHIYGGECPDELEGRDTRDPECPACQVLTRAVLAAPQQVPVSMLNGWKLVPADPTDAMQMAGAESIGFDTTAINKIWTGNKAYRAMIAAAPMPPPTDPILCDEDRSDALQDLQFVAGFEAGWSAGVDGNEALLSKVRERSKPARVVLAKVQQNKPQIIPEIIPAPSGPVLSDAEIIRCLSYKFALHSGRGEHAYIKCHHWYATADDLISAGRDLLAKVRP
ncbi:hypothetical protein [Collimonas sp.]|uniref:hypothetical protein n=1 Tax=Collimonas sp. TaxID=1963772 RepID=UPI002C4837E5|nr:hypothetical protein [Collimonas sp.]HWW99515.1 hypothetical protein [Collimonas sp.]